MKAIVLFSGGQDSTTCLYWALNEFKEVLALNIQYGQKHQAEINAAYAISKLTGVQLIPMDLSRIFSLIGNSALTDKSTPFSDVSMPHPKNHDLPASFVPGRNLIFITVACMVAYKHDANHVITGVSQADYSGYPDCRKSTIAALSVAVEMGMEKAFHIHTPLINVTKKEEVLWAKTIPGCMEGLAFSHTCYNGQIPPCGECPACKLRAKGFAEAQTIDPLIERLNK